MSLIAPHGGKLVNRILPQQAATSSKAAQAGSLPLDPAVGGGAMILK